MELPAQPAPAPRRPAQRASKAKGASAPWHAPVRRVAPAKRANSLIDQVARRTVTTAALIQKISNGWPVAELEELRTRLDLPLDQLALHLGISKATLHRRKATGRLAASESDRVARFARLLGCAVEVMESELAAQQWLSSPQHGLGGAIPLAYARTEVGARAVEDLLGRIEYGVYS